MLSTEKNLQCTYLFSCENASSSDKAAATGASTLISLAGARFAAASCFSSFLFFPGGSWERLFSGWVEMDGGKMDEQTFRPGIFVMQPLCKVMNI